MYTHTHAHTHTHIHAYTCAHAYIHNLCNCNIEHPSLFTFLLKKIGLFFVAKIFVLFIVSLSLSLSLLLTSTITGTAIVSEFFLVETLNTRLKFGHLTWEHSVYSFYFKCGKYDLVHLQRTGLLLSS